MQARSGRLTPSCVHVDVPQLINMLVHQMPRLMMGSLAFLAHQRGVLDLTNRRLWLRQQITELRQRNYASWHQRGVPLQLGGLAIPPPPPPPLPAGLGSTLGAGGLRDGAALPYGITTPLPYSTWGDTTRICVVRDRLFRDAVRHLLRTPLRLLQQVRGLEPAPGARAGRRWAPVAVVQACSRARNTH